MHEVMAEIRIGDDVVAALEIDPHSVLTNDMSAGVIFPEIGVSGALDNSDSKHSL